MSNHYTKPQTVEEKERIMQHKINVSSKEEGAAVEKALANPVTKAIVVVEGVLAGLNADQQARVIRFVQESLGVSE